MAPTNGPGLRALQEGQALLEAGRRAEAIDALKAAAEGGVAEGCVQLAALDIEQENRAAAAHRLREAAELAEKVASSRA